MSQFRRIAKLASRMGCPLVGIAAAIFCAHTALAQDADEDDLPAATPAAEQQGEPVKVSIEGVKNADLLKLLERSSELITKSDRKAPTRATVERWVDQDSTRFTRALRAEGYYQSEASSKIHHGSDGYKVTFTIDPGPIFVLAEITIDYDKSPVAGIKLPQDLEDLGLTAGAPARGATVVEAERNLKRQLANNGYPFAELGTRDAVVDLDKETMEVTVPVTLGPHAQFGTLTFEGLETVDEDYLRRLFSLPQGETYDQSKVDDAISKLSGTGLFDTVVIEPTVTPTRDGPVDLVARVVERDRRTVGAGVRYSTAENTVGVTAFWEHRNLFGEAESLRFSADVSLLNQSLASTFRKPNLWRLDQAFIGTTTLGRQDFESYNAYTAEQDLRIDRRINQNWNASLGTSFEYTVIDEDEQEDRTFFLIGLPGAANWQNVDNPLNPTRGGKVGLFITPYTGFISETLEFAVTEATGSTYYDPTGEGWLVLAGRTRLGSILGENRQALPASKRFYAGGGGSVRGFAFQHAGPLNSSGAPLGGRSVFEVGAELRFRVTEEIGLVPFVEGGTVYGSRFPDFHDRIFWGAGLGFRYFTAIGPLRLDLATPLNPRENDDRIQFYISIGQAF